MGSLGLEVVAAIRGATGAQRDGLTEEWLPDFDELTPMMKLKRRLIAAKYAPQIEALYTTRETK
jgi:long-subunit acyl-CoA synthetase (AMP-forming)